MSQTNMLIAQEALHWLVRVNDPAFADWDGWNAWMSADAQNAATYWRLASAEQDAVELMKSRPAQAGPAARPARIVSRRGFAIAAGIAVVVGGVFGWSQTSRPWTIETALGELRTVDLPDGSQVVLDGGTRLNLDRRRPRQVELEAGRALFYVVHDATRPFKVAVNGAMLTDLGTVFDVTHLSNGSRISVTEGRVQIKASTGEAVLNAGDGALVTPTGVERRTISVAAVSDWREGRLTYSDERLAVVAQDLSRVTGRPVSISKALANRRFTGSVMVRGPADTLEQRLGVVLDVQVEAHDLGWRLEPRRTQ